MKNDPKVLLSAFLLLGLASCSSVNKLISGDDKTPEKEEQMGEMLTETDDMEEEKELAFDEAAEGDNVEMAMDEEAKKEELGEMLTEDGNKMGEYVLGENETLMMMAFKIYGDYRKWKEIKKVNGLTHTELPAGTTLKYTVPAKEFAWNPKGLPYLVLKGDTLGIISKKKYDTTKKWRHIYENNRPLIRDPNLIFAGFTLYYIPKRDLASE